MYTNDHIQSLRVSIENNDNLQSSDILFARSQDQLAIYNGRGTGHKYTAQEALLIFGKDLLLSAIDNEGALISKEYDSSEIIKDRRDALGISREELSKQVGIDPETIVKIENKNYRSKIADILKVAFCLGLDPTKLPTNLADGIGNTFAVRLKQFSQSSSTIRSTDVLKLSECGLIISKQMQLMDLLGLKHSKWNTIFEPDSNYGSPEYPAYQHGYYLALQTREKLGFNNLTDPITSIRKLCEHTLGIPLIQSKLSNKIAGATLAVGENQRGIVININGQNENVWIRRSTIAHELGHIFYDPDEKLSSLNVDTYDSIQNYNTHSKSKDFVEQRANAFAAEFLAPREGIVELYKKGYELSQIMEHFGISHTLARHQLKNSTLSKDDSQSINPEATEIWVIAEENTVTFFPVSEVLEERRGHFAKIIVDAEKEGFISEDTAALYFGISPNIYKLNKSDIESIVGSQT